MKYLFKIQQTLKLVLLSCSLNCYALDSTGLTNFPTLTPGGSPSTCSYVFMDIFSGTTPGATRPSGTTIVTQFYNNGTPSTQSTTLPCDGTYQVFFEMDLQGSNVSSVKINPLVIDSTGTVIIVPLNYYLYPQCNNASYSSTPYCTIGKISLSAQLSLKKGVTIAAPIIAASSSVILISGMFYAYLVSSP